MKLISKFFITFLFLIFSNISVNQIKWFQDCFIRPVLAQENNLSNEEILEAEITNAEKPQKKYINGREQIYQVLNLKITKGSLENEIIQIDTAQYLTVSQISYETGDQVLVRLTSFQGENHFQIIDFIRSDSIIGLFLIFFILAVFIAKKKAVTSVLGMAISFIVIFFFILPQINQGANPILISALASLILIPITFYLSHGFNQKTTIAVISTFISLFITSILSYIFVKKIKLTGFSTEEASFLFSQKTGAINMQNLLIAGIIIGLLGILDDITIAQSALVEKLKKNNPKLNFTSLFQKSMDVGKDHIASMINTLILVYTGSALPLFLLFINSDKNFSQVLNYEQIATEITIMLLGSIGVVIAVPITTFFASIKTTNTH